MLSTLSGTLADHPRSILTAILGAFLLMAWALFPVPSRSDLAEINGELKSYSIEADQNWFKVLSRHRTKAYVLFKVVGREGRFWSDALGANNVTSIFAHDGSALRFYCPPRKFFAAINGDGVKTYGLSVDGVEIQSVDDAIEHDSILAHYVLPALGALLLGLSAITWEREETRSSQESE